MEEPDDLTADILALRRHSWRGHDPEEYVEAAVNSGGADTRAAFNRIESGRFAPMVKKAYSFFVYLDRDEQESWAKQNQELMDWITVYGFISHQRRFDDLSRLDLPRRAPLTPQSAFVSTVMRFIGPSETSVRDCPIGGVNSIVASGGTFRASHSFCNSSGTLSGGGDERDLRVTEMPPFVSPCATVPSRLSMPTMNGKLDGLNHCSTSTTSSLRNASMR